MLLLMWPAAYLFVLRGVFAYFRKNLAMHGSDAIEIQEEINYEPNYGKD